MTWLWLLASLALAGEPERAPETGKGAGSGALEGFAYGSLGGVVLSTFSPWFIEGDLVNIYVHAGVDALILAAPGAIIGGVVGARKPRSTLRAGRFHVVTGLGFTDFIAQRSMKQAYEDSGLAWHAPWWFGRAHWPRGFTVAAPYAWNGGADVRVHPRWAVGVDVADLSRHRIVDADGAASSWANGWNVSVITDFVINPVYSGGSRIEFATGLGVGLGRQATGGEVDGLPYRRVQHEPTLPIRVTMDWYATARTSLQFRVATRMHSPVQVDEFGGPDTTLGAHDVQFSSFDLTMGVRWHFGEVDE